MQCWQIDFKDVSTVVDDPTAPTGKKQHVAEAFNIVDEGTSVNTIDNIRNVRAIVGNGRVALITSAYHMPRALQLAALAKLEEVVQK